MKRKFFFVFLVILLSLLLSGCNQDVDYYAALQYEWLVTEKPSSWPDSKYVFTADRKVAIYHTDGVTSWVRDEWPVEKVDSKKVYCTNIVDGHKYSFDYTLSESGTVLTITHYFGAEYIMKFTRQ